MAARKKNLDPIAELEVQIEKLTAKLDKARLKKVTDVEKRVERSKKALETQKVRVATARSKVADNRKPTNAAGVNRLNRAKDSLDTQLTKQAELKETLRIARADLADAKLAIKQAKQVEKLVSQTAKSLGVVAGKPQTAKRVSKPTSTAAKKSTTTKATPAKKTKASNTTTSKKATPKKTTAKKATTKKITPKKTVAKKPKTATKKPKTKSDSPAPAAVNTPDVSVEPVVTPDVEPTADVTLEASTTQTLFEQNSLFGEENASEAVSSATDADINADTEERHTESKTTSDDAPQTPIVEGSTPEAAPEQHSLTDFDTDRASTSEDDVTDENTDETNDDEESVISLFDPPADD